MVKVSRSTIEPEDIISFKNVDDHEIYVHFERGFICLSILDDNKNVQSEFLFTIDEWKTFLLAGQELVKNTD